MADLPGIFRHGVARSPVGGQILSGLILLVSPWVFQGKLSCWALSTPQQLWGRGLGPLGWDRAQRGWGSWMKPQGKSATWGPWIWWCSLCEYQVFPGPRRPSYCTSLSNALALLTTTRLCGCFGWFSRNHQSWMTHPSNLQILCPPERVAFFICFPLREKHFHTACPGHRLGGGVWEVGLFPRPLAFWLTGKLIAFLYQRLSLVVL